MARLETIHTYIVLKAFNHAGANDGSTKYLDFSALKGNIGEIHGEHRDIPPITDVCLTRILNELACGKMTEPDRHKPFGQQPWRITEDGQDLMLMLDGFVREDHPALVA
ncbi:MAG: hypothetical protein CMH31_04090 [Micavibrio sp.]|nr:hypothetical protein [Micavibrio sp.]|tara:strand:+ start:704 stop:1030 length:327 start_codon:yes stop_codon:yes gene_type:complete